MAKDKYSAIWVSHSSIGDFLKCPRAYYLKNVYKDPKTGHKIKLMSPPLALGQAVHEVLESLSVLATDKRFKEPLIDKYEIAWNKISGKRGGFPDDETELKYKNRGREMIEMVQNNPGPLKNLAVKINMDLPHYWLSEDDNIILCGKIDWLEYLPDNDSVNIIDFKTSRKEEGADSLQLPIYHLLVHNCQKRKVEKASYWYLELNREMVDKELPDLQESHERVLKIAKKIKLARQLEVFKCAHKTGCFACKPYEAVLRGEAEFVGTDEYRSDVYVLHRQNNKEEVEDSILL
ncbi:MAG: RecB family exonuclease [Patescibacteria group bacterium]|jgi:ATP-dependent helicase/DNAse subunit B